jgi:hypothetical protein
VTEGFVRLGSEVFMVVPTDNILSLDTLSEAIPLARAIVQQTSRAELAELGISRDLCEHACVIELARRLAAREVVIALPTAPVDAMP